MNIKPWLTNISKAISRDKSWLTIITKARAREYFTSDDRALANFWPTCACGQLDADIPRKSDGEPLDVGLYYLGKKFTDAVDDDNFYLAESLITAITARATVVLAELATNRRPQRSSV